MSKPRLEGKVTIITGAASGIGEAAARLFAAEGAIVVIADIMDDLGAAVVASIGPDRCSYKHCDVRDERQVEEVVSYAVETYGRLDVMFSNAGTMGRVASIVDLTMEEWDNVFAINVRGPAACIKHAARAMVAKNVRGSIIVTASLSATIGGFAGIARHAYPPSKHGVYGLVKSAAGELGRLGIRVSCVSPAGVATPQACKLSGMTMEQAEKVCEAMSPFKGVALKAHHIAEAALFLASDETAPFVSGHNLIVDGGQTVVGPPPPALGK